MRPTPTIFNIILSLILKIWSRLTQRVRWACHHLGFVITVCRQ